MVKKVDRVCFVDFCGSGGMLHYAEALNEGYAQFADSRLISTPNWLEKFRPAAGIAGKVLKKYNPNYYAEIADQIIESERPDIVHVVSDSVGLYFFIRQLKRCQVKVIYTVHDPKPHEESTTTWGRIFSWINRRLLLPRTLREAALIHVHSDLHKEQLIADLGNELAGKVYVVPHGGGAVKTILNGTNIPPELPSEKAGFVFLFFGRIEPYKGIGVLLEAFNQLRNKHRNAKLIIAGSGNLAVHVGRASDPDIYILNRFIADDEVRYIFEYSDVVVLPYLSATQSGVVHLAYEFQKPVIASRVGALPEIVIEKKTGALVEPGDAAALCEAMAKFIDDPDEVKAQGGYARTFMETTFAWSKVASMHRDRYCQLQE